MSKTWYAVQVGNDYEWDDGSYDYNESRKMAENRAADPENKGLEVRIAYIDDEYKVCDNEEIIAEGTR